MKSDSGSSSPNEGVSRVPAIRAVSVTIREYVQVELLGAPAPHTWIGRHELAKVWRVEMALHRASGRGGVDFSDEICFCLVREIVMFACGTNS